MILFDFIRSVASWAIALAVPLVNLFGFTQILAIVPPRGTLTWARIRSWAQCRHRAVFGGGIHIEASAA